MTQAAEQLTNAASTPGEGRDTEDIDVIAQLMKQDGKTDGPSILHYQA